MHLLIGIPSYGVPDTRFTVDSLAPLMYHIGRRHPEIKECTLIRDTRTYRHHARQAIANAALGVGADYLLMLDDDVTFTNHAFDLLWEHNEHPIISGLYFTRSIPPVPCMFKFGTQGSDPILKYPKDSLFEVEIVGFGFLLFQTEIFRKVPAPHFQVGSWLGEDVAFGAKCQAAGLPLIVHTGCKIGHIMEQKTVITEKTYEEHKERIKRERDSYEGSAQWSGQRKASPGEPGYRLSSRTDVFADLDATAQAARKAKEEKVSAGGENGGSDAGESSLEPAIGRAGPSI